jgi:hypothetical protein
MCPTKHSFDGLLVGIMGFKSQSKNHYDNPRVTVGHKCLGGPLAFISFFSWTLTFLNNIQIKPQIKLNKKQQQMKTTTHVTEKKWKKNLNIYIFNIFFVFRLKHTEKFPEDYLFVFFYFIILLWKYWIWFFCLKIEGK